MKTLERTGFGSPGDSFHLNLEKDEQGKPEWQASYSPSSIPLK